MNRNRRQFRLGVVAAVALFGFLGVSSLVDGSIRVRGVKQLTIKKNEEPQKYWLYTGTCLAVAAAGAGVFAQTFMSGRPSRNRKKTDA